MPISRIKTDGIQDDAVTSAKIGTSVIVADDLDANSVTVSEIQDGAVTSAKLDTNIDIAGTLDVTGVTTLDNDLNVDSGTLFVDVSDNSVGIGTTSIDNKFNIQESALSGRSASNGNTSVTIEHATDTGIQFFSATQTQLRFGDVASTGAGSIIYDHSADNMRFSTDESEALRIDSSGFITKPKQPAFLARLASNTTVSAINTWAKVPFDTVNFNRGSHFSTSNNRFIAPVDGIYQFNATVNMDMSSGSATRFFLRWYKNGNSFAQFGHDEPYASDRMILGGSITVDLSANDYFEVFMFSEGGTSVQVNGGNSVPSTFSGFMVG